MHPSGLPASIRNGLNCATAMRRLVVLSAGLARPTENPASALLRSWTIAQPNLITCQHSLWQSRPRKMCMSPASELPFW